MTFNQSEIIKIKEIVASLEVPMKIILNTDGSIDIDFSENKIYVQSIIRKKENNEFDFYGTDSNKIDFSYKEKSFESLCYKIRQYIKNIKKDNPIIIDKKSNITNLSKNFYQTFYEAIIIENLGFKESSGMIYRKSMEFLVKDFLISNLPDTYNDFVLEKTIGAIVKEFYIIDNNNLKVTTKVKYQDIFQKLEYLKSLFKIISNTFNIGNDFSHYERRLLDFSSTDMKNNIFKIIDYIDLQVEEEKNSNKKTNLNKSFDAENLITKNVNKK